MRLLICAGGTGGGVYPALAVHSALMAMSSNVQTLWVGSAGGMEEGLVDQAGLSYRAIPAAGVHGVAMRKLPNNLIQLARGLVASYRILREFRPDVLFFTGGYVAGPMAFAGQRFPTLVYVPDIEPGMALKFIARMADRITVTTQESQVYFKKDVIVTGYPLRAELRTWNRKAARAALGLSSRRPTLLVFGGSQGARSLNMAVLERLPALLEMAEVIHITGRLDWEEVEKVAADLNTRLQKRYHRFTYLHEMGKALAASDVVVSRAGASSLGEFPFFGIPAILVPYPHAWRYQKVNAEHLARHGAAIVLVDSRIKEDLLPTVEALLRDSGRRQRMQAAMRKLAHPKAAQEIASQLLELSGEISL